MRQEEFASKSTECQAVQTMTSARRLAITGGVLFMGLGLDRIAKNWALSSLTYGEANTYFFDTFRLQLAYNRGAFLSLGDVLPDFWRQMIFNVGVGLMLLLLLGYMLFSRKIRPQVFWASALLLTGGLGNLWDRLVFRGSVVDFMNFGIGPLRTGIVNVADMLITLAVGVLLIHSFREGKPCDKDRRVPLHSG